MYWIEIFLIENKRIEFNCIKITISKQFFVDFVL